MDCQQTNKLLSNYFDDELSDEQRIDVEGHIKDCTECSQQLAFFAELSEAIRKLSLPAIPREMLWERITAELDALPRQPDPAVMLIAESGEQTRWPWAFLSTAAIALIALGLSLVALTKQRHPEPLQTYVNLFETNPEVAQQQLVEQYSGRTISPDQAVQLVGYHPRNVDTPPSGFVCDELVLLNMPCCKCVQAVWQRSDGSHLAVFERRSQMDDWFADHPSIHIECEGASCRITQLDGQLVASWRVSSRVVTVIGVRDTEELAKLVAALS